ncbi:hypothetical protein CABS01_13570, partial [Colletotrichum abscissum]|uniref:uncharacterized protein n=1 Tax=Colletotrichum abscissum TaxID=1671311 RepID=UPI0027D5346A
QKTRHQARKPLLSHPSFLLPRSAFALDLFTTLLPADSNTNFELPLSQRSLPSAICLLRSFCHQPHRSLIFVQFHPFPHTTELSIASRTPGVHHQTLLGFPTLRQQRQLLIKHTHTHTHTHTHASALPLATHEYRKAPTPLIRTLAHYSHVSPDEPVRHFPLDADVHTPIQIIRTNT